MVINLQLYLIIIRELKTKDKTMVTEITGRSNNFHITTVQLYYSEILEIDFKGLSLDIMIDVLTQDEYENLIAYNL